MNDEKQKPIKTIRKNHQISNFSNWTMNMCVCAKDWIDDEPTMAQLPLQRKSYFAHDPKNGYPAEKFGCLLISNGLHSSSFLPLFC
jgi:hypothetical protein